MREKYGVELRDRRRVKDLMLLLGECGTVGQSALANSVG